MKNVQISYTEKKENNIVKLKQKIIHVKRNENMKLKEKRKKSSKN